jgi:hypothetical protein
MLPFHKPLTHIVHGADTSSVFAHLNGWEVQEEINKDTEILFMVIKKDGKVIMELDQDQAWEFICLTSYIAKEKFLIRMDMHRASKAVK